MGNFVYVSTSSGDDAILNTDHIVSIVDYSSFSAKRDNQSPRLKITTSDGAKYHGYFSDDDGETVYEIERFLNAKKPELIRAEPGYTLLVVTLNVEQKSYLLERSPVIGWSARNSSNSFIYPVTIGWNPVEQKNVFTCVERPDGTFLAFDHGYEGITFCSIENWLEEVVGVDLAVFKQAGQAESAGLIKTPDVAVDLTPATFVPPAADKKPRAKKAKPVTDQSELGWE